MKHGSDALFSRQNGKTYHHGGLSSVFHLDLPTKAASGRHVDGLVRFDVLSGCAGI